MDEWVNRSIEKLRLTLPPVFCGLPRASIAHDRRSRGRPSRYAAHLPPKGGKLNDQIIAQGCSYFYNTREH